MGVFAVGDVLLVPFPFSDLQHAKRRPVLVVGISDYENLVVCQITSKAPNPKTAIKITESDMQGPSGLQGVSYIRANKLFTAAPNIVMKQLGNINTKTRNRVYEVLLQTFKPLVDYEQ